MTRPNAPINISVTFRHTDSTDALKNCAIEKLTQCLRKYVGYPADVHVVLSVQKRDHIAEVQVHSKGYDVTAKAVTVDLYSAIDKVVDNIDTQLRKRKERTVQHKHQASRH